MFCDRSVARVGGRGDVDEPYDQRAVGWPIWALVRGRRRRRHLRHRRHRRKHLLQRRPEERRQRFRPDSATTTGVTRGILGGLLPTVV